MCVSSSSRYQLTPSEHQFIYLTSIHFRLSPAQVSKFGSHLHSSYISPPSKSLYPCVTSIQIMSHLHPSPDIHVSPPTRSRLNSIQVTRIVAQLHLCPFLPKIQVSIYAFHLDQCLVSPPLRSVNSRLTTIQVKSHINLSPKICIARLSRSCLTSIKDRSRYLHPACVATPSKSQYIGSQLHPGPISPQSRSQAVRLTSIPVPFHLHPDF